MKGFVLPVLLLVLAGCQTTTDTASYTLPVAPNMLAANAAAAYAEDAAAGITYPYFQPSEGPIPDEVLQNLPAGITAADLWWRLDNPISGPCYFYKTPDGNLHPVTMPPLDPDQPYCIM